MRYRFGNFELDTETYELRDGDVSVPVERQVFDVLAHLLEHCERVVPKEELLDEIWGDRFVSESALSSRIMSARKAVNDDGRRQQLIKTVHGRGFRFVGSVDEVTSGRTTRSPADADGSDATTEIRTRLLRRSPRTRYATGSAGGSIAYQVVGEGPTDVVFVPGFVSNVELQWEFPPMADFFARLASFSRLIIFDKRGTGLSERLPADEPVALEERMDDVRAVMDAAGSQRATLLGISEGGPLSVLFAATYPERVERLALVNSFARRFREDVDWGSEDIGRWWGTGTVYEFLAPSWAGEPDDRRFLARYERHSATPATAEATIAMNDLIDVRPVLAAITVPTLVVHRIDDAVIPVQRGREIAEGIEGAQLIEIEGADHLVFVDSGKILDAVEAFVAGRARRRPGIAPSSRLCSSTSSTPPAPPSASATSRGGGCWKASTPLRAPR